MRDPMPLPKPRLGNTSYNWYSDGWDAAAKFYKSTIVGYVVGSATLGAAIGAAITYAIMVT